MDRDPLVSPWVARCPATNQQWRGQQVRWSGPTDRWETNEGGGKAMKRDTRVPCTIRRSSVRRRGPLYYLVCDGTFARGFGWAGEPAGQKGYCREERVVQENTPAKLEAPTGVKPPGDRSGASGRGGADPHARGSGGLQLEGSMGCGRAPEGSCSARCGSRRSTSPCRSR